MLRRLGQSPYLCIVDNGSEDGTADALKELLSEIAIPHRLLINSSNLGISIARNQIIEYMLECGAEYLLMLDGDIEIVPFSSFAMLRSMENSGHILGLGPDSAGHTPHRQRTTPCLYNVVSSSVKETDYVAWTQYGMFRRSVFEDGVRFEETYPFSGVGWGFEDNDLALQMTIKGYLIQQFFGMIYLHRHIRSSLRIIRGRGLDPQPLYELRRQFLIDKSAPVPEIRPGLIDSIRPDKYPERR